MQSTQDAGGDVLVRPVSATVGPAPAVRRRCSHFCSVPHGDWDSPVSPAPLRPHETRRAVRTYNGVPIDKDGNPTDDDNAVYDTYHVPEPSTMPSPALSPSARMTPVDAPAFDFPIYDLQRRMDNMEQSRDALKRNALLVAGGAAVMLVVLCALAQLLYYMRH